MKKNVLLVVLMITIATIMVGCGNKNTEKTTENNEVIESTTETTQEVEETTEETITEEPVEEEVIGDVDIAPDELTMEDMTEQVIGLDIPMVTNEGTDKETFKDFTVIFPSPMFITEYSDNGARANLESIDFIITAVLTKSEPSNNIRENMGETQEYIGENYVLEKKAGRNNKYGYQVSYDIINITNNNRLMITVTINKIAEYQEYCDKLVDEFSVAFEESIRKNLQ